MGLAASQLVNAILSASLATEPNKLWVGVDDLRTTPATSKKMSLDQLFAYIATTIGGSVAGVHFCDNIAALAGLSPADGDLAFTTGYDTVDDEGERRLMFVSGSTATVDGVEVFTATGGRWIAIDLPGSVTCRQAGMKADGLSGSPTNNYTRAVAMIATGLLVEVSNGVYGVNGTLTFATAGQTMVGHGNGAFKQLADNQIMFSVTANDVTLDGVRAFGFGASADPVNNDQGRFVSAVNVARCRVRHCRVDAFSFAGVRFQGVKAGEIHGNTFTGSIGPAHDSSGDIMMWGNCDGISIVGNYCLSDLDLAIAVGSLSGDNAITIVGNVCITMNSSGVITNPTNRRRCITLGYQTDADAQTNVTVSANVCWGALNAGIYFNGWGGSYSITGNIVGNCSIGTVDESLSGCITVRGSARSFVISGNVCTGQISDAMGAISIYRDSTLATPNMGSVTIQGNVVHDCSSYGITVHGSTDRLLIAGNNVWNCTLHAIYIESYTVLDARQIRISNNQIVVNSSTACGVWMDTQGGTNRIYVHDNNLHFTGTKGAVDTNVGIFSQRHNLCAWGNEITGFKTGIYFYTGITGRVTQPDIHHNTLKNLDIGVVMRGTTIDTVCFIDPSNIVENCGVLSGDGVYYDAVRVARVDRFTGLVEMALIATPANGTWLAGDRVWYTSPAAGGAYLAVYTPGGWKSPGNLAA